eukprot:gene4878-6834_t
MSSLKLQLKGVGINLSDESEAILHQYGVETIDDCDWFAHNDQLLNELRFKFSAKEFDEFSIYLQHKTSAGPLSRSNAAANESNQYSAYSTDVKNVENTVLRWTQALNFYAQTCTEIRNGRSQGKVFMNVLMDTSGSMFGTKLIAAKLGLCALIANLNPKDEVNISIFNTSMKSISSGFLPVEALTASSKLSVLLSQMYADGSTSCYDSLLTGIQELALHWQSREQDEEPIKNVMIVLTDGEDTSSEKQSNDVLRSLMNPKANNFMFMLIAVDMHSSEEANFRSWMELRHCKQISVNVRSGAKLVQVFREILLSRVLHTQVDNNRFLQMGEQVNLSANSGTTADDNSDNDSTDGVEFIGYEDAMDFIRRDDSDCSRAVSRCNSISDDNEFMITASRGNSMDFSPINSRRNSITGRPLIVDEGDIGHKPFNFSEIFSLSSIFKFGSKMENNVNNNNNNSVDSNENVLKEKALPAECYCPIYHTIMVDPVICVDGHTYERSAIETWLRNNDTSPVTNLTLTNKDLLIPNHSLRKMIQSLNA